LTTAVDLTPAQLAALLDWAERTPAIRRVLVFGSRAKGTARPDSDLDLAVDLDPTDGDALAELIVNRGKWREELTRKLGLTVKDIYPAGDPSFVAHAAIAEHGVVVFER
jgi:predicted nucleotidyltransferase